MTTNLKYRSIHSRLESSIQSGDYQIGDRLPSERDLSKSFGVSMATVRQALSLLEQDGVIKKVPWRGTFVERRERISNLKAAVSSNNIALVVLEEMPDDPFYLVEARKLEQELSVNDRSLMLCFTSARDLRAGKLPSAIERGDIGGVILHGYVDDYHVACFQDLGLPVVAFGNRPIHIPANHLSFDFRKASYLATRAMVDRGLEQVVFITGPQCFSMHFVSELYDGYRQAVREAGVPTHYRVFGSEYEDVREFRNMVSKLTPPFGLLAGYLIANSLSDVYAEYNLGFDENPVAFIDLPEGYSVPCAPQGVSYLYTDLYLEAKTIASLIERAIGGGSPTKAVLVPDLFCASDDGFLSMDMTWHVEEETASTDIENCP